MYVQFIKKKNYDLAKITAKRVDNKKPRPCWWLLLVATGDYIVIFFAIEKHKRCIYYRYNIFSLRFAKMISSAYIILKCCTHFDSFLRSLYNTFLLANNACQERISFYYFAHDLKEDDASVTIYQRDLYKFIKRLFHIRFCIPSSFF